jgi:adenosine deaminase
MYEREYDRTNFDHIDDPDCQTAENTPIGEDIPRGFLAELPKTDLHLHLDGSLRLSTLIELAREQRVSLPSYEDTGMRELVFKDEYNNLGEYLSGFQYTCGVMQNESALERVSYELAQDCIAEGVCYIEVRFAPQLHMHDHMNALTVIKSVNKGLQGAQREYNNSEAVLSGLKPPFHYGIIVCAMRMFGNFSSEYFNTILKVHQHSPDKKVFALASLELAQAVVHIRDEWGLPIVGFDLAGQEEGYPAEDHREAYRYAHKNFLKKTVHAGEAYGPESIFQAITDLYADRIGHGFHLFNTAMIKGNSIADKQKYVDNLCHYIADRRITLEICLKSNLQTNRSLRDIRDHSFTKMRERRLSTTICTDNRLVSNTTVTDELERAVKLGLSYHDLKSIIIYGFKRSFFPGTYLEKRKYARQVIDYYEQVEKKYFCIKRS